MKDKVLEAKRNWNPESPCITLGRFREFQDAGKDIWYDGTPEEQAHIRSCDYCIEIGLMEDFED